MDTLREILPRMVGSLGLGQRYRAELIVLHWRDIVGNELALHTQPGKVRRGVLSVAAKNAVWAHHLTTLKEDILAKVKAFAGENAVSDLRFQAGYFQNDQNEVNGDEEPSSNFPRQILDENEQKAVEGMVAAVADDDIRRKLKRLLAKEATLRKARKQQSWQGCSRCGVLCPPKTALCSACTLADRNEAVAAVRRMLRDAPWLSYEECRPYAESCRLTDYRTAKAELIDVLLKQLNPELSDQFTIKILAMLFFEAKPQAVDQELIDKTLARIRRKKHVSSPRS
jgi:hypothetical protein